jgi:hypothetical protein
MSVYESCLHNLASIHDVQLLGQFSFVKSADPLMMIPTITPNRPSADANISITRILTKSVLFSASDRAQLLPTMPTQILHSSNCSYGVLNLGYTATAQQQLHACQS